MSESRNAAFPAPTPSRYREPATFARKTNELAKALNKARVYAAPLPVDLSERQLKQILKIERAAKEMKSWAR